MPHNTATPSHRPNATPHVWTFDLDNTNNASTFPCRPMHRTTNPPHTTRPRAAPHAPCHYASHTALNLAVGSAATKNRHNTKHIRQARRTTQNGEPP